MNLIIPGQIAFKATVTEEELRKRMGDEVLAQVGGLNPDGSRRGGLSVKVTRGDSRKGGYTIEVSGPTPQHFLIPLAAPRDE